VRRVLLSCALAVAVSATAPLPAVGDAIDPHAAALFALHRTYVGWSGGDGSLPNLREVGEFTRDGTVMATFTEARRGAAFRYTGQTHSQTDDEGFTGRVAWWANVNGFTVPIVGDVARFMATEDQLDAEALDPATATVLRDETVDGTATTVVHVVPKAGVAVDLWIDAAGAYKRIVYDPAGAYEERIDVLRYAEAVPGKRVIGSWRLDGGHGIWTITGFDIAPITDDELHPPKQRATWSYDPSQATVPVELTEYRILFDATVNGVKGHFALDTGADGIVVTDTFARRANAQRVGRTDIRGIGGGAVANVYTADTIAVGANVLHDVKFVSGLDESLPSRNEQQIDGFIGFDLLADAIVDLNLDDGTMRILDPKLVQPDSSHGFTVGVDLSTGQPRVPMLVGGKAPVTATLDSGNPIHVLFGADLVGRDHVPFFEKPGSLANLMRFYGVNGEEVIHCGQLESLTLGPIAYRPVPACASPSMPRSAVLVGLDFLRAFNIVFDYPDGILLMTPRKNR
jgi:hypothetical protein